MIFAYAALLVQQPAAPSGGAGSSLLLIQIPLIIAIFYFLMFRPQQKQRKKHEESLRQIKKGDEIVTAGGIVARVVHVKETVVEGTAQKTMDDRVTIESGESRLVVERGKIARIVGGASTGT